MHMLTLSRYSYSWKKQGGSRKALYSWQLQILVENVICEVQSIIITGTASGIAISYLHAIWVESANYFLPCSCHPDSNLGYRNLSHLLFSSPCAHIWSKTCCSCIWLFGLTKSYHNQHFLCFRYGLWQSCLVVVAVLSCSAKTKPNPVRQMSTKN